jgi:hypothetical protein
MAKVPSQWLTNIISEIQTYNLDGNCFYVKLKSISGLKALDFGFAVKQRQSEVKSDYQKKADKLDAEYHQPGDATTFKSILNEYGKDS